MSKFKCDTCSKRTRESDGIYVRCSWAGDTKKKTKCDKYADQNIIAKKMKKIDMLNWVGV